MNDDGELLEYMGLDATRWTEEFCKIARDNGHDLDAGWMLGWFANAIEAARAEQWHDGQKVWIWRNGDHFLAYAHEYPCYPDGGDPLTLGEPVGYAILKFSAGPG